MAPHFNPEGHAYAVAMHTKAMNCYSQHIALLHEAHARSMAGAREARPLFGERRPGAARAAWLSIAAGQRSALASMRRQIAKERAALDRLAAEAAFAARAA